MTELAKADKHSSPAWEGAASTNLFRPIQIGSSQLKHRVAYAPLTRVRNDPQTGAPTDLVVEHYAQRATDGGLLITEATMISPEAGSMPGVPGIWSQEQVAGWKKVTDAVHAKNGKIWMQFWHLGRTANPKYSKNVWSAGTIPLSTGSKEIRQLTKDDLAQLLDDYRSAARNALDAGFDGIELHGANGYLIDQFLQSVSNNRTDEFGGEAVENRIRFPAQVVAALADVVGEERLGVRMSPFSRFQEMREPEPLQTFLPWTRHLTNAHPRLAYIHVVQPRISGASDEEGHDAPAVPDSVAPIRDLVRQQSRGATKLLIAGAFDARSAAEHADRHDEDVVVFGRYYIANPDLPERIRNGHPLRHWDRSTFYIPGAAKGYVDQPTYQQERELGHL
ncbi:uncharacterized protein PFL1_06550 [Pseudozyma flocculosa PF-1]|uniref:Related to NADPH2 dehydrogenase chain OYE2 n=2 Tax=Pseudozyma flocculosa TaxID=84751 RepID=A0A5C3F836_9BASI|nr:uncharacterized protein PFL1_06550 [Pseudozyma flocculosa PF-1]EPQ25876.1 hypothetical protein PFL1_06550 [Pseudozyma flocculosa PF-1]SPO40624.1 related to NADPH2 dehydrogenase chain OYE2 [Pseudozyma flocculosa]